MIKIKPSKYFFAAIFIAFQALISTASAQSKVVYKCKFAGDTQMVYQIAKCPAGATQTIVKSGNVTVVQSNRSAHSRKVKRKPNSLEK